MRFTEILLSILFTLPCIAGVKTVNVTLPAGIERPRESHYRDALAEVLKAKGEVVSIEVVCKGGRCDIVTLTHAIEVEHAKKWHEAIGQACHYALMLRRKPAIALYKNSALSDEQFDALKKTASRRKIDIYLIKLTHQNAHQKP